MKKYLIDESHTVQYKVACEIMEGCVRTVKTSHKLQSKAAVENYIQSVYNHHPHARIRTETYVVTTKVQLAEQEYVH